MNQMQVVASADAEARPKRRVRKKTRWGIMLAVPLALLAIGLYWWLSSGSTVETDNAAVKQDIVSVSAQVNGPIIAVAVKTGDQVRLGQVLFRIDPAPFQVALEEAEARLAAARLQTGQLRTEAAGTGSDITGAAADLEIQQRALSRQAALLNDGFTTRADYDDAVAEVRKAETVLAAARARSANAGAALAPGEQPSVAQAQAEVDKARLDLSRTIVRASMDGTVANADRLQVGQMSVVGLGMLSLVRSNAAWVEANFKEQDVGRIVPGQKAKIKLDAYPGTTFQGHVESVGAGTGSEFALLPAQNANGNWVKVTQRVPIRIAFDGNPKKPLIAGLSATATVTIGE